jgi:hypothetical protein
MVAWVGASYIFFAQVCALYWEDLDGKRLNLTSVSDDMGISAYEKIRGIENISPASTYLSVSITQSASISEWREFDIGRA